MSKGMLGKLRLSDVRGPVAALYEKLASADGQQVLDELKKFNQEKPCWMQDRGTKPAKSSQSKLLEKTGYFSAVTLKEQHDPNEFYKDREGFLYVFPDFRDRIVADAKPVEANTKFKKISRFMLAQDGTTGEQLRQALPNSVWEAFRFCAWLSIKLQNQSKGEEGELLNTGWANLFLVEGLNGEVFVVRVLWHSDYREWDVRAWPLDDTWHAGSQFASRN